MSHWRTTSRSVILRTIADAPPGTDISALFKLVSKAYPFGERKMHPYKIWLSEVGRARRERERLTGVRDRNPLHVNCRACGARIGTPCRPAEHFAETLQIARDAEEWDNRPDIAAQIRLQAFHEVRRVAVGLVPSNETLPLFAGAR